MEKLNNKYANDYNSANKNGVVFNQIGKRKTAILNAIESLIVGQISFFETQKQQYKGFFINRISEDDCDVCLVCYNEKGNPVTRKYTISA